MLLHLFLVLSTFAIVLGNSTESSKVVHVSHSTTKESRATTKLTMKSTTPMKEMSLKTTIRHSITKKHTRSSTASYNTTLAISDATIDDTDSSILPDDTPRPITLVITPVEKVYYIHNNTHYPLPTCIVLGTNLKKIKPYNLSWYVEDDEHWTEFGIKHNGRHVTVEYNLLKKYIGSNMYCALKFNRMEPKYFAMIRSPSLLIKNARSGKITRKNIELNTSTPTFIGLITSCSLIVVLSLIGGLLYCRFRKPKATISSTLQNSTVSAEDNVYSYVPKEAVTFYEAKAMAASNQRREMESVKPPPLPRRPNTRRANEDEYIYSYAYGIKPH